MHSSQKTRLDIHAAVTDKIIAAIEAGAGEWKMPWHRPGTSFSIPTNALTHAPYRGINILSLWIDADEKKFPTQVWATYKQYQELGAQVRGGEKGSLIVKYGEWSQKDAEPDDNGDAPTRTYARAAWVFNIAQVDGLAPPAETARVNLTTRLDHVERFLEATGAEFRYGGQRAFYRHRTSAGEGDYIQMPDLHLFTGTATSTPTEALYATMLHELLHWSGAAHRLNREHGKRFGDEAYAFEEMLVEIGAAALCCQLSITNEPRPDHAQYIDHWLKILRSDKKAIFAASAAASRAADYLWSLQPNTAAPLVMPATEAAA